MANQTAKIDNNRHKTLLGVTDDANAEIRTLLVDATTGRLKISANIAADALISTTAIDAKTTGATTLYTVPTGYQLFVTKVLVAVSAQVSATVGASASVGSNSTDFNDIVAIANMGLLTVGQYGVLSPYAITSTGAKAVTAGADVKIKITTAVTATSQTLSAKLFGFLVAV